MKIGETLLILNDGRISVGYKKGITIYDPDNFKETFDIEDYGPFQSQLQNGMLLASYSRGCAIFELSKENYNIKILIDCDDPVLYVEALSKNYVTASVKYRNRVYVYELSDNYKKSYQSTIYLEEQNECKFMLNLNENEMFYVVSTENYSPIKKSVFYDYKKEQEIKSLNIYIDVENKAISKINNNFIAAAEMSKMTLIDIKNHKVAKLIDIEKNIFSFCPLLNDYLLVGNFDDNSESNLLQQYEFDKNVINLKLVTEKKNMKIDSFIKKMGYLPNGNLVLLTYSGSVKILSTD